MAAGLSRHEGQPGRVVGARLGIAQVGASAAAGVRGWDRIAYRSTRDARAQRVTVRARGLLRSSVVTSCLPPPPPSPGNKGGGGSNVETEATGTTEGETEEDQAVKEELEEIATRRAELEADANAQRAAEGERQDGRADLEATVGTLHYTPHEALVFDYSLSSHPQGLRRERIFSFLLAFRQMR